jgi:hypothetical protein
MDVICLCQNKYITVLNPPYEIHCWPSPIHRYSDIYVLFLYFLLYTFIFIFTSLLFFFLITFNTRRKYHNFLQLPLFSKYKNLIVLFFQVLCILHLIYVVIQ